MVDWLRRSLGGGRRPTERPPEPASPEPEAVAEPTLDEDAAAALEAEAGLDEPEGVACPSCAFWIVPPPRSSRLCPRCRERIVVRHVGGPRGLLHRGSRQGVRGGAPAGARRAALDGGAPRVAAPREDRGGDRGPAPAAGGQYPSAEVVEASKDALPVVRRQRRARGPSREALERRRAASPRAGRRAVRRGGIARAAAGRHRRPAQGGRGGAAAGARADGDARGAHRRRLLQGLPWRRRQGVQDRRRAAGQAAPARGLPARPVRLRVVGVGARAAEAPSSEAPPRRDRARRRRRATPWRQPVRRLGGAREPSPRPRPSRRRPRSPGP